MTQLYKDAFDGDDQPEQDRTDMNQRDRTERQDSKPQYENPRKRPYEDPKVEYQARPSLYREYFVPGENISYEVIQRDICCYLGRDATVRPSPCTEAGPGYLVTAYRGLTAAMIRTLEEDSEEYRAEVVQKQAQSKPIGTLLQNVQQARPNPFQREGKRYELPLLIQGQQINAQPDTGFSFNALRQGLFDLPYEEEQGDCKEFLMPNGTFIRAVGRVSLTFSFAKDPQEQFQQIFFVFPMLSKNVKVIIGKRFLEETKTLTENKDRLTERVLHACIAPRVLNISPTFNSADRDSPQKGMRCLLNNQLVIAHADTGSDINLVSSTFADHMGLRVVETEPYSEDFTHVEFADGSTAPLLHKAVVRFDTERAPKPSINTLSTLGKKNTSRALPKSFYPGFRPRNDVAIPDNRRITFYVLNNLTYEVILGEPLLDSLDAWTRYAGDFQDMPPASALKCGTLRGMVFHRSGKGKREVLRNTISEEIEILDPTATVLRVCR